MRLLFSLCSVLLALTLAALASAQTPGRLTVSPNRVEVGEAFSVELTVDALEQSTPTAPKLKLPKNVQLRSGPSIGTSVNIQLDRGGLRKNYAVSLSWVLVASKTGKYSIGPASFSLGNKLVTGEAQPVEVVEAGTQPRARRRRSDPFSRFPDPFGRLGRMPDFPDFPSLRARSAPLAPPAPDAAYVEHAPDSRAFIRIVATPAHAVVGQEVRVRIFAYGQGGPFRVISMDEPDRPDFVAMPLTSPDITQNLTSLEIDGEPWYVMEVSDTAMFPLHAGDLTIGSVSAKIDGVRFGSRRRGPLKRRAPAVTIHVSDPPAQGRPAGYQIGDVGNYNLTAEVSARRGAVGESIAVTARLAGRGNVPPKLKVPFQHGIEWLEPTITEQLTPFDGAITGWRQFVYLVRLNEEGNVDLGELTLPYWNPDLHTYEVAAARLGTVRVRASASTASAALPLRGLDLLGPPRAVLAAMPPVSEPWTEQSWYWALLIGAPFVVGLVWAGSAFSARPRRDPNESRVGPRHVRAEMVRAKSAAQQGHAADAASGAERALHHAIEVALGVNARGMLRTELERSLRENGVPDPVARSACHILETAEAMRYTGAAGGAKERDGGRDKSVEWVAEAGRTVDALLALTKARRRTPGAAT